MQNYLLTFVLTTGLTLLASLGIYTKVNYNLGSENEVKIFRKLVLTFILYLIVDIFWALMVYQHIWKEFIPLHVLTVLDTALMGLIPFFWFFYVEEFLQSKAFKSGAPRYIFKFIMYTYLFIIGSSFKTSYIYSIEKVDGKWFVRMGKYATPMMIGIFILFLGGAVVHGLVGYFSYKSKKLKKRSLMVIGFTMPMIVGLSVYYKYMVALVVMPSIFVSIQMFFLSIQDQMIFTDNLTGLFNRKMLVDIEDEGRFIFSEHDAVVVYYLDIDKFKNINDTYGHYEGDRVLRIVGNALKNIENTYNATAIRMGGDEFIISVREDNIEGLNFKTVIRDQIDESIRENNISYDVTVSIGEKCCDNGKIPMDTYIKDADEDMYQEKRLKKQTQ